MLGDVTVVHWIDWKAEVHKLRILHECSCFIEFIKQVGEEIKCEAC